jgi:hypothetical protein
MASNGVGSTLYSTGGGGGASGVVIVFW